MDPRAPLVILGAGPAGYAAAFHAAGLGLETTLVDPEEEPGGVCLYRGCIPSKALLHVARLVVEAREARAWGVHFEVPRLDVDRIRAWREEVVAKQTRGLAFQVKRHRVRYLRGRGRFLDGGTVQVDLVGGESQRISFDHALLATGSVPARLPDLPSSPRIWDSTRALALPEVPGTLLVVGGGYIGLELGTVYAALGSRVTVAELTPNLLPGADRDLVRVLARRLEETFHEVLTETRVDRVREVGDGVEVHLAGPGGDATRTFDRVLVSVGRKPMARDLGLERTAVRLGERGFVEVDASRRTAEPRIWAAGDVVGEPMLAHKASHEARVAVESMAGRRTVWEPRAIPAVVFTDPEIAWCGLTETEARERGEEVKVAKLPWGASSRAGTMGRTDGLTKVLADPATGRVRGVGMVGPGCGELIAEAALAMELDANATDLRWTIHPHPTLSEMLMETVESLAR